MKKLFMILLVLAVAAGALFAAGEKEGTAGERPTLHIWVSNNPPEIDLDNTPTGKMLEDALQANIKWEYTVGDSQQKAGIILASGEYPDAIACGNTEMAMFVDAGVYTDLSAYIRNSPALDRLYPQSYIDSHFVREDGVVPYLSNGVPNEASLDMPGGGWMIQQAVLEFGDYPRFLTFDEYIQLLRDYAEANPTINGHKTYAYIFQNTGWQFDTLTNPPAELDGYVDGGGFWFDDVNGKWVPQITTGTDNEKRFLKTLNELYMDGLLDEESFVHSQEQYKTKLAQGNYLGGYGYSYQQGPPEKALREQGLSMHRWVGVPVAFEEDIVPPHRISAPQGIIGGFAIMPDAEDKDLVWDVFVERWLSDDAITARWWKIPGESFSIADDGTYYMTEAQMIAWWSKSDQVRSQEGVATGGRHLPYASGLYRMQNGSYLRPNWDPEIFGYKFKVYPEDEAYLKAYNIDAPGLLWTQKEMPSHGWTWNISREDEVAAAYAEWDEFRRRWVPRLILADAGSFEAVWDNYIDAFEDVDVSPWMERAEYVGNYRKEHKTLNANP